MPVGRFQGEADAVLRAVVTVLRWAARIVGVVAVVLLVAGGIDTYFVSTFAPTAVTIAVGVVVALLVLVMFRYRSRLRWVVGQEQAVRDLFGTGTGSLVDHGRRVSGSAAELLPKLQSGSMFGRLRALRELVSTAQGGTPVGQAKDIAGAVTGPSFAVSLYGMVATAVAIGVLPILAVASFVAR